MVRPPTPLRVTMTTPPLFRYYLRVRYQECDAQHVVFNARYGDYIDLAITEFMKASMPDRNVFDGTFEFQVVKQTTQWKAPARFDDVLEITSEVTRLGTTSFTVQNEFRKAGSEPVLVTADTVYVHVDNASWRPKPLPDLVRERFAAGARGKRVDHAGWLSR